VLLGYAASRSITGQYTSCNHISIGAFSGFQSNRTCCIDSSIFIGYCAGGSSLLQTVFGHNNTFIGSNAVKCQHQNNYGIAVGYKAGFCRCKYWGEVLVGRCAGAGALHYHTIAIGSLAHAAQTTSRCAGCLIAIGFRAAYGACRACYGIAIGACAHHCNTGTYSAGVNAIGFRAAAATCCVSISTFIGACAGPSAVCVVRSEMIGFCAGGATQCACHSTYIGSGARSCNVGIGMNNVEMVIGTNAVGNGNCTITIGNSSTTKVRLEGPLTKTSGSFRIVHPNPSKKSKWLNHSFVESPNEGDNVYRWTIKTCRCKHIMALPSYYKYLNKNDMVWIKPVGHFGRAYAQVDENQENLSICSNKDGEYNVLLIATRKDKDAVQHWKGAERDD